MPHSNRVLRITIIYLRYVFNRSQLCFDRSMAEPPDLSDAVPEFFVLGELIRTVEGLYAHPG